MIHDIVERKIERAGLARTARSLFREHMPPDVSEAVMTRLPIEGVSIDFNMPGFHRTSMQVIVRNPDPEKGMKLATDIMNVLSVTGGQELHPATRERGEVRLKLFHPRHLPARFPRLEGDELEFSINFLVVFSIRPLGV